MNLEFASVSIGPGVIVLSIIAIIVIIAIIKTAVVVPQRQAFIIERLGKYRCTLEAGFHILLPFFDRVAYRHTMKEQAIDVPPQQCITKDNIAVDVDGILYLQVMDAAKASYGIGNYLFATVQLAQTTMRSEMGKLDLDRSFEERTSINAAVVAAVENGFCTKNADIIVKVRGGDLIVNYSDEGVYLTGTTKLVFEGSVEY